MKLPLLLHGEVPAAHLVVETRAACIHHQSAFRSERRFEGQMDGIGTSGNFSDRSHRSMQHDGIASSDAQVAKVIREFRYRIHTDTPKHPPQRRLGQSAFLSAASVYYAASRRLVFLRQHPLVCGLFYGAAVEVFRGYIVLPLSALHERGPFELHEVLQGLMVHMFVVGLPISFSIRRFAS